MLISSYKLKAVFRIAACVGVLSAHLEAQTDAAGWISAPVLGLFTQDQVEVRALLGVVGSATVSNPIVLPAGITGVYLAPTQRWALVEQTSARTVGFMTFNGIHPSAVRSISGVVSAPDAVSFSPTGRAGVLLSGSVLQVVTGLDGASPQVAMQSAIPDLVAAGVQSVTVSDDGGLPVVLTKDGRVSLVSAGGASRVIAQTGAPAGLSFLTNQRALAIADGAAATVSVMDGLTSLPFPKVVVSGPSLSGDRLFVQTSSDAKSLVVAAEGATTAYRIELADRSVRTLDVPAGVSQLERMRSNDSFLYAAKFGEAAWLLLADSPVLKTSFAQATPVPLRRPAAPGEPPVGARPEPRAGR